MISLNFKPEVLDHICKVLAQRPWAEVNDILLDIQNQANNQPKEVQNGPDASTAG